MTMRMNRRLAAAICYILLFTILAGNAAVPAAAAAEIGAAEMQQGQQIVPPTADAYVQGGASAANNFGKAAWLDVKHIDGNAGITRESLLSFDLAGVSGAVGKAELYLYETAREAGGAAIDNQLYSTDTGWDEAAVTWNTKPAYRDRLGVIHSAAAPQWHTVDVTEYVRRQVLAGQPASFGIRQETASGIRVAFASKEAGANAAYLKITEAEEDTQAPIWSEAAQLQAVQTSSSSVGLSWPPASDPVGVAFYRIYMNGLELQTVTGSVYQYDVGGLTAGSSYTFKVEAGDTSGNWSLDGPQMTVALADAAEETKLPPSSDAYVHGGGNASNNYGAAAALDVKHISGNAGITRESLLAFDLTAINGPIGTVELYVYGSVKEDGGANVDNQLYSVDPDWEEATVTWNTKPAFRDYLGLIPTDKTPQWHALDVTAYVKRQAAAGRAATFGIRQEAATGLRASFASKEAAANAPYLRITGARAHTQAPLWPASAEIAVTDPDDNGLTLSWPSAEDADGIAGYRVYRNGQLIDTVSGTTLAVEGLTSGSTYTFTVQAGDSAGNWSGDGPFSTVKLPETKLVQTKLGNVFLSNEPVAFDIVTGRPFVSWTVLDVWGEQVASGRQEVVGGQLHLAVPVNKLGYFTLTVNAERENQEPVVLQTPLAILAPYDFRSVADSPFGTGSHMEWGSRGWSPEVIQLIEYAGFKNVRDGVEWSVIEKTKGNYEIPQKYEDYIDEIASHNLNLMMLLAFYNPNYDDHSTPYTDAGREGFANYGKFMMERLGDKVSAFEVYNEFNIEFGRLGNGIADSRPDYYYPLLKATYDKLKQTDPSKPVAGMATSNVPISWMRSVFELGGFDELDKVSIHPYQFPGKPENLLNDLQKLQSLLSGYDNGNPKPIWITEIGYPTNTTATGVDEKKQADYLVRTFVLALASGVEKISWHDFMNDGLDPTSTEHNYGLIYNTNDARGKNAPKPAYAAMGAMTRLLTGATFAADESQGDAIRQYKFTKGQEDIRVVWSAGQLQPVAIRADGPVRIADFMGNEQTYYPHDGNIYFTLKDEPIYVKGSIEGITADESVVLVGEPAVIGEDAGLTLNVVNDGTSAFNGTFTVAGHSYPVQANPGQALQIPITAPGLQVEGSLSVMGQLKNAEGQPIGLLTEQVPFSMSYAVQVRPTFTEDGSGKLLKVTVNNRSSHEDMVLNRVDWTLGALSGTMEEPRTIPPLAEYTATTPLADLNNNVLYDLNVKLSLQNYDPVIVASKANFTPVYPISERNRHPATVDWTQGIGNSVDKYGGTDDLSGTTTLNWDEDNFYITATIRDDVFHYEATEKDMFVNDGFQFGVARGIPGESAEWYDSGFSLTPAGLQAYKWIVPSGAKAGLVDNRNLTVTRDETAKTTTYQFALPWSELAPVDPDEDDVFSFSLLLNENDGNGRRGFLEWGSGIGTVKDPKRYRTIQLIKPHTVTPTEPKSKAKPGMPVLSNDNGYDTGLRDGTYTVTMNMWYGDNGTVYKLYENGVPIDTQLLADGAPAAQQTATAISGRKNGTYRYVAKLTNAFGTTTGAEMVVEVTDAEPGRPVLSNDNWDGDGRYRITMNMWWGTNGTTYRLYENGVLIDTQALADGTPNAQTAATTIANRAVGTYEYRAELVNDTGAVSSPIMTVRVTR